MKYSQNECTLKNRGSGSKNLTFDDLKKQCLQTSLHCPVVTLLLHNKNNIQMPPLLPFNGMLTNE